MTTGELQHLLEAQRWVFAKTLAHRCVHFYTVRSTWANDADFAEAVKTIRRCGKWVRWPAPGGWAYRVIDLGDWRYWICGGINLINRRLLSDVRAEEAARG
jgi:hypothetical protein